MDKSTDNKPNQRFQCHESTLLLFSLRYFTTVDGAAGSCAANGRAWLVEGVRDMATASTRRPRILMLHGWTQNAALFAEKAGAFRKKLRGYDLFFAEAPHLVSTEDAGGRDNARSWWTIEEVGPAEVFRRPFIGWAESRRYIAALWDSHGPFDGLVGFSQGAVAVHQLVSETLSWVAGVCAAPGDCAAIAACPPRFAVLVCGFPSALAISPAGVGPLRLPTLHLIAEGDLVVPPVLQAELADRFSEPTVLRIDKGHAMPQRACDLAIVVKFVEDCMSRA
jgi:dienelactone hydrolase